MPVIFAVVSEETPVVVMLKVAVVAPPATLTLLGGTAAELLEASVTVTPAEGAATLRVTVPVEEVPPATVFGDTLTLLRLVGSRLSVPFTDVPLQVAVSVTGVLAVTAVVVMLKLAVVPPAGIVFDVGGIALALFDVNFTICPPAWAGALIVTSPLVDVPPTTVDGVHVKLMGTAVPTGLSVRVAGSDEPLHVAVIVAVVTDVTAVVVTLKLAVVPPPGIVLVPGGTAWALFDEK